MTLRASTLIAFAALVAPACAPHSAHDRASLSRAFEQRAGYPLRSAGSPQTLLAPGVTLDDGVTEGEAVAVALWNNAPFQADLLALELSRADLVEAGMIRNPIFTLLLPLGPKQLEMTAWIPLEALWQRPRRVEAAQTEVERVATQLVQSGLNFVRDVRLAFVEAQLSQQRRGWANEALELRRRVAAIAEARFRSGDISELERVTAAVDERRAAQDVLRFEFEERAAQQRLAGLLGLDPATPLRAVAMAGAPSRAATAAEEVREALALRPDLRAAELGVEAARSRASAAFSAAFPPVSLIADANGAGLQGFEAGPGLQLELPIFSRGQGAIARADADFERAVWAQLSTQQRIRLEVQQAWLRFDLSEKSLALLRDEVVVPLQGALSRSEKAFAAGEVSYLLVLETSRQLLDARLRELELTAELWRAAAELDRARGRKRSDAH